MAKEAFVYSFKYEMKESSWSAFIAAFSQEEAVSQLYKDTPGRIERIVSNTQYCKLDAVSDSLRNDITMPEQTKINELLAEISVLKKAKDLRTLPKAK